MSNPSADTPAPESPKPFNLNRWLAEEIPWSKVFKSLALIIIALLAIAGIWYWCSDHDKTSSKTAAIPATTKSVATTRTAPKPVIVQNIGSGRASCVSNRVEDIPLETPPPTATTTICVPPSSHYEAPVFNIATTNFGGASNVTIEVNYKSGNVTGNGCDNGNVKHSTQYAPAPATPNLTSHWSGSTPSTAAPYVAPPQDQPWQSSAGQAAPSAYTTYQTAPYVYNIGYSQVPCYGGGYARPSVHFSVGSNRGYYGGGYRNYGGCGGGYGYNITYNHVQQLPRYGGCGNGNSRSGGGPRGGHR